MTTSDFTTKQCRACNEYKPLIDFYTHPSTKDGYLNYCKSCFSQRTLRRKHPIDVAVNSGEIAAIEKLRSVGIDATPGKMSQWRHQDVVCENVVRLEVKKSRLKNDRYLFKFDSQVHSGMHSHLIFLICDNDEIMSYHVFESNHPVFLKDGKRKMGVQYIPNAHHRKTRRTDVMTPELMESHEDNWKLIWDVKGFLLGKSTSED